MAAKVVLVDTSFEHQESLEDINKTHNSGQFSFETTASFAQDANFWAGVDVLVLNVPDDGMIQNAFLEKLKTNVASRTRVIIMAPAINPLLIQVSHHYPKVRLMKLPVTGYALFRALVDITTDYPRGKQQVHPRFLTDLEIGVVSNLKSVHTVSRVKNMSISGAYFETPEKKATFAKGDMVRLSIQIPLGKAYEFDARVVWVKDMAKEGVFGYGCAFLNKEQVYDELLAQVGG